MHPKSFLASALVAGSMVAAQEQGAAKPAAIIPREAHNPTQIVPREAHNPTKIAPREAEAYPATPATPAPTMPVPSGIEPSKFSKFQADMSSYQSKVKADPMYTSMRAVMKTAVPQSYKDAIRTNPASVHQQFASASPEWYSKLPANVKKFMEKNQKEAKSIWEKDVGPLPTGSSDKNGKKKDDSKKEDSKKKSEAPGLSLVGATVFAVVGAFGVAALLL